MPDADLSDFADGEEQHEWREWSNVKAEREAKARRGGSDE